MSKQEELAKLIAGTLHTQSQDGPMPGYVATDGLDAVIIDGSFNLLALAGAIINHEWRVGYE